MSVREASPQDAEAIALITNDLVLHTTVTFSDTVRTPKSVCALIEERSGAFWVCERDGIVTGYASYAQFRSGSGYLRCAEHTIAISEAAWGLGEGRALMATLEAHADKAGIGSLVAGISGENANGVAFHRALGFTEVGRVEKAGWKFSRWLDLILMQKMLRASR